MPDKKKGKKDADPNDVPLGTGLADRARAKLRGRRKSIDDVVEDAVKGRRKNQSTDSNQ